MSWSGGDGRAGNGPRNGRIMSRMTSARPAVELRGLTKRFGAVTAVDGLDLTDRSPGEMVAFLGPNGAGKTTTIDMLLGLSRPDAGTVAGLRQAPARRRRPRPGRRRHADRRAAQGPHRRARRSQLTAALFAHTRPVAEVLERAGIAEIADRRVGKCSGGQQQRLRFAMALLPDPDAAGPRRADHRHGRRGPPRVLDAPSAPTPSAAGRSCSPPTTSTRPTPTPTGSCWSARPGRRRRHRRRDQGAWPPAGTSGPPLPGADAAALAALPGVDDVELRGDTVLIRTRDSDAVARHLLTPPPPATWRSPPATSRTPSSP